MARDVVFIAGIGQDASAWRSVADGLHDGWRGHCFAVSDLVATDEAFTMAGAVAGVHRALTRLENGNAVLCGLSLGAMIATSFALAHPEWVRGLVLVGSQVRPNPALMFAEAAAVSVLPASWLGLPEGLTRARLREIIDVAGRIDYRSALADITDPALVVCGEKDRINLPAAKALAEGLPHARLDVIPDAGHELNTTHAVEFGSVLSDFLATLPE